MSLTDNFAGVSAIGAALTVVVPGTPAVTVPIQGILEFTPPARNYKKANYTPLSGTLAGKEQVLLCSEQAASIEATVVYGAQHKAAMDSVCGVNGAAVQLVLPDGSIYAGNGGVEKVAAERISDGKEITDTITVALAAGWTFTPGTVNAGNPNA